MKKSLKKLNYHTFKIYLIEKKMLRRITIIKKEPDI